MKARLILAFAALCVGGCTQQYPNQSDTLTLQALSAHSAFATKEGRAGMFFVLKQCHGLNSMFAKGKLDRTIGFSRVKATQEKVVGEVTCRDERCVKFGWNEYFRFQLRKQPEDAFDSRYEIAMSTGRPKGFSLNHPELLAACGLQEQTGEVFVSWQKDTQSSE